MFFGFNRFVCANFAQQSLPTEAYHLLLLRVAEFLPVKTLIPRAHAPAAVTSFINLANPPARALDGEKFQLLCHFYLHSVTISYSEDPKRPARKGRQPQI